MPAAEEIKPTMQALDGVRRVEWDGNVLRMFMQRGDALVGGLPAAATPLGVVA